MGNPNDFTMAQDQSAVDGIEHGVDDTRAFDLKCTACKGLVGYAIRYIEQNGPDGLHEAITGFCNALPYGKKLCLNIVAKYLPEIIHLIVSGINPTPLEVCVVIHLC